jgi:hypothetical protein
MPSRSSWKTFLGLLAISLLALAVHGYHYGIEDEAIYLPAVKQRLSATLYPFDSAFFQAQSQLMLFDRLIAALCRLTHLRVDWAFFLLYCLTTFLFVLALRRLGERFFPDEPSRWAAVLLPAALLTMPVAGSAVFIMDQHMHPRNLATVALLFALAAVLDKRWVAAGVLVVAAAAIHPLVTLYGASLLCMFAWRRTVPLHFLALAVFLAFAWFLLPPPPAGWWHAVEAYIFISEWAWYKWLGILGPLACLLGCAQWASRSGLPLVVTSARRLVWYGLFYFSVTAAFTFIPRFAQLTPSQPMRALQLPYLFLFLFAAGLIWRTFPRQRILACVLYAGLCGGMFYAQRQEFPASPHVEWPGKAPVNPWLRAFDWIRRNTPVEAYFVLHPRYLERPGEDFHGFRGLAERSALADMIKDRSVATVRPALADDWWRQAEAQLNWSNFGVSDLRALKQRFGVDWVLLERGAPPLPGSLVCPYQDGRLLVCRID